MIVKMQEFIVKDIMNIPIIMTMIRIYVLIVGNLYQLLEKLEFVCCSESEVKGESDGTPILRGLQVYG